MPSHVNDVLGLIHDTLHYLKRHPDSVFANAEDCDYFRKKFKKARPEKPAPIVVVQQPIEPKPLPEVVLEKPIPPKPLPVAPLVMEEKKAPPPEPKRVVQEPLEAKGSTYSFQRWRALFAKVAPECHAMAEIPNDALAKKINSRWKTKNQTAPITVLCYQEIPEQKALLEQIAKALDVQFGPAKLALAEPIEKEKQWEALLSVSDLKLVVCCDYTLWQLPGLLHFYKEVPALKTRQIGDKPLFLLPDLSLYLKDPLLKRSLWKALCQTCDPALQPSSSTKT